MAYRVKTEAFEGPFDLLLYLVSRKKVDIGAISVSEIADQYLAEISRMGTLDLDVASDFLVVAATLLELKAQNLLPAPATDDDDDPAAEVMSPAQAKLALIERLITYKQFKNAAGALDDMHIRASQMCPRPYGPTSDFADLMPDFLNGVPLERLAALAAGAFSRREVFLLESKHIASKPIPVEACASSVMSRLQQHGRMSFSEICRGMHSKELLVANFLALLELYKRRLVDLRQLQAFGDIEVELLKNAGDAEGGEGVSAVQLEDRLAKSGPDAAGMTVTTAPTSDVWPVDEPASSNPVTTDPVVVETASSEAASCSSPVAQPATPRPVATAQASPSSFDESNTMLGGADNADL